MVAGRHFAQTIEEPHAPIDAEARAWTTGGGIEGEELGRLTCREDALSTQADRLRHPVIGNAAARLP